VLDVASPKFQLYVGELLATTVDVFVKVSADCAQAEPNVKLAEGAGCMFIGTVVVPEHPSAEVEVSTTLYIPAAAYTCVGFCSVLDVASPKFQFQLVIDPLLIVLVLLNVTEPI
jgi:hypothetical protein